MVQFPHLLLTAADLGSPSRCRAKPGPTWRPQVGARSRAMAFSLA